MSEALGTPLGSKMGSVVQQKTNVRWCKTCRYRPLSCRRASVTLALQFQVCIAQDRILIISLHLQVNILCSSLVCYESTVDAIGGPLNGSQMSNIPAGSPEYKDKPRSETLCSMPHSDFGCACSDAGASGIGPNPTAGNVVPIKY